MTLFKKPIVGLALLALTTAMLLLPQLSHAASNELDGTWRGELVIQTGMSLTIGITITNGELTLDSPNQGMFGKVPTEFEVTDNTVSFTDADLSATYSAVIKAGALDGTFTQGKARPLVLEKLNNEDLERMALEGTYVGELVINRRNSLPLRLNVAVLQGRYLATLDSPAQESYGIPISEVSVTTEALTFTSPMISASFSGKTTDKESGYVGRFIQGQARPLTLKKLATGEAPAESPKPKLGDNGGAAAVITPAGVEKEYFQDHTSQTQYEIGSVSKTFVAYLLAQQVAAGDLALNDNAKQVWSAVPAGITFAQLATHHSGLPRLPEDLFEQANPNDPYAHYNSEHLQQALEHVVVGEPDYEYSNLGYGLLGELLGRARGQSFASLVKASVFKPFGMSHSYVALAEDQQGVTEGHDILGEVVAAWHFQALAGAGAIVATLDDMVQYTSHLMALQKQKDPAVELMLTPVYDIGAKTQQALGWIISEDKQGNKFAWHNGQTAGFSSFVGFYLDSSRAVVALNSQSVSVNEEALALLTGAALETVTEEN
ncbi:MAG TPA: serine hydrolase domain-containing protein [Aliidiomarina sp.]|nr:serine hydrolase domain-containing protein [Aliidiomarina sp.]